MKKLCAFYFSGTGNTRYVVRRLLKKLHADFSCSEYDISRGGNFYDYLKGADLVMLAFPVYGSSPPVPVRQFVYKYASGLAGKDIIIVATQYIFSGDGAASLGRTVAKLGGRVKFAEHFNMPNNLSDCRFFAVRNGEENAARLKKTERRMDKFARRIREGKPFCRGFKVMSHAVGYFGQRMFWRRSEKEKRKAVKIDLEKCIGCGICAGQCPSGNIKVYGGVAHAGESCVFCYRCVNSCPRKAVTIFGKEAPRVQYRGIEAGCTENDKQ